MRVGGGGIETVAAGTGRISFMIAAAPSCVRRILACCKLGLARIAALPPAIGSIPAQGPREYAYGRRKHDANVAGDMLSAV